jgi:hypothetical protein
LPEGKPTVVRLRMPDEGELTWEDHPAIVSEARAAALALMTRAGML